MNKRKIKAYRRFGIITVIIAVIITGVWYQISRSQQRYVDSLETTTIIKDDIVLFALATGKVTSANEQRVSVNGTVSRLLVSLGEEVSKDQRIAEYRNAMGQTLTLRAPMTGIISKLPSNIDNELIVSDPNELQLIVNISERDVYKIQIDQGASVFIEAINQTFEGLVVEIGSIGNTSMDFTTYPVTVSFDHKEAPVFLGMSASASIEIDRREDILVVPFEAIISEGTQRYVIDAAWKDDPSASQRDYYIPVVTGFADVFNVEVIGNGLEGKSIIILPKTAGFPFMRPR